MLHYHGTEGKMESRMTGGCGLSRKLLTVILLSWATMSWSADNSIYIDQAGDNAQVTMTQDGVGNRVQGLPGIGTSSSTPAKIYGDGNLVTINQTGSGNVLGLGIDTTTGSGAPTVSYSVTGNNAQATIKSMNPGSSNDSPIITVDQQGDGALLNIDQAGNNLKAIVTTAGGDNNSVTILQRGNGLTANVNMAGGGGNVANIDQQDDNHTATVLSLGATNTVNITQSGGALLGHTASVDLLGSGNTVNITQSGTGADSITNLKSVGNGNTFGITQRN